MAGGKETPRQKMIGMMYLVLTALLALNVSKQIVAAFVTLNDKIDQSADHLESRINRIYGDFEMKGTTLKIQHANMDRYNLWYSKSLELKSKSNELVGYLLGECNEMITKAEGEDWVDSRDLEGNITSLKSLDAISNMDDYDIPTNLFVGGNPEQPAERGMQIVERIHAFRDFVTQCMGTYQEGAKSWNFDPHLASQNFSEAIKSANPEDTLYLGEVFRSLTIPERIKSHDEDGDMPWVSVVFDHAPIVAAAAIFTSLKLDVMDAHAYAVQFMLDKIDVISFRFNKVDAVAMASAEYINMGDSLNLNVRIAAYDTTEALRLRFGIDGDTADHTRWKETDGAITLKGSSPGDHKVKGEIGVQEKGVLTWKPWEFDYTVGQPMGIVSQPEMRVLYWGYDNKLEGTASGYAPDQVSLSATGCTLTSGGNGKYIAHVERGVRNATIRVLGRNEKGESIGLGQFDFVCKPLPPAELHLGPIKNGEETSCVVAKSQTRVTMSPDPSVMLTGLKYEIKGGTLSVAEIPGQLGTISSGGNLDPRSIQLLRQSCGKKVVIEVQYKDDSGITRTGYMSFKVS